MRKFPCRQLGACSTAGSCHQVWCPPAFLTCTILGVPLVSYTRLECQPALHRTEESRGHRLFSVVPAGDARYPSPGKRSAHTMASAVHLLRMVSCCKGSSRFLRRSGLVLRCVHMLRQLLAGPLVRGAPACHALQPCSLAVRVGALCGYRATYPCDRVNDRVRL